MKIRSIILVVTAIVLTLTMSSWRGFRSIKGDGNIVTKSIDVSSFDRIVVSCGSATVNYTQSEGAPSLIVKVDKNIYDLCVFSVKDRTLEISLKRNSSINPTRFDVAIQSSHLSEISIPGAANVNIISPIKSSDLELNIGGSGNISSKHALSSNDLDLDISGSGHVHLRMLDVSNLDVNISGSGSMDLSGTADAADYKVRGSGSIKALGLETSESDIAISGSGNGSVYATDRLDVRISGSGELYYKSTDVTKVTSSISGSGRIKSVN